MLVPNMSALDRIESPMSNPAQVAARRWKVDTNSRQDAVLMLSSVNLPGGVQVMPTPSSHILHCPNLAHFTATKTGK